MATTRKIKFTQSALLLAAITSLATGASYADSIDLDTLTVVSAAGFEQKVVDAPASISVVTRAELEKKSFNNIAEAIQDLEGVDVGASTGKTGGLNISLRGMPSEYTLILIDGRRQNPAGNVTPNGFNETHTSFLPPLSAIERIEVIRGPMSTLYGSDAMGGVINIITRKVADEWGGNITGSYLAQERSKAGDEQTSSVTLQGPLVENKLGLSLRADIKNRESSNLYLSDGSELSKRGPSPVEGRVHSLGAKLSYTPTAAHDIVLDVDSAKQKYNNDDCQLGTLDGRDNNCAEQSTPGAQGYSDKLRFHREQASLSHTGRFDFGQLDSSLMHNKTTTRGRTIPGSPLGAVSSLTGLVNGAPRKLDTTNLVFDSKFTAPLGDAHFATLGTQWWKADMTDGIAPKDFSQKMWALFAEDEWFLHDDVSLTLGGRYDRHDAFGGHFSPRAYLIWNTDDHWTVKGGVSQGYKTPRLDELHSGVNGVTGQGTRFTIGNPDLEPEISTSTEVGFYYDSFEKLTGNFTLFYNHFKDKIAQGDDINVSGHADIPDGVYAQQVNVDKALTYGAEFGTRYAFTPTVQLAFNYTYTDSEQKSGNNEGAPLTNTAKHLVNTTLNWQTTDKLNLWLRGEYRGKRARFLSLYENLNADDQALYEQLGSKLKAFELFHLGGTYQPAPNVRVSAAVYNLLDKNFLRAKTYTDGSGNLATSSDYAVFGRGTTGTLDEGRRYWLSVSYDF